MRNCGDCQLCCVLLPVNELDKRDGERCQHQRHGKGCAVYRGPGFPMSCGLWNCRWLVNDDTADLRRPDRSHYVIDILPEVIGLSRDTGERIELDVIQVWVDPKYPDAHRDPALRRYLERQGKPALLRFAAGDAMVIVPPSVTQNGEWFEGDRQPASTNFKGMAQRMHEAVARP